MTTEMTRSPTPQRSVETNLRMANSLRGLLNGQVKTPEQVSTILRACQALRQPANEPWLLEQIFTLLTHYYVSDLPEEVAARIADDWAVTLDGLPDWAVRRACLWWTSAANKKRRQKPLPGDIEDRAKAEMGLVAYAEVLANRGGAAMTDMNATNAARMKRGEPVPHYLTFGDGARTMLQFGVPQDVIDRYAKGGCDAGIT